MLAAPSPSRSIDGQTSRDCRPRLMFTPRVISSTDTSLLPSQSPTQASGADRTVTVPSVPCAGSSFLLAPSTPSSVLASMYVPGAASGAMVTVQVYNREPSGIGVSLASPTVASTPLQAVPLQPSGRKLNEVDGLSMTGFTVQAGRVPTAADPIDALGSKPMALVVATTTAGGPVRR